jgi:hypothetical protein
VVSIDVHLNRLTRPKHGLACAGELRTMLAKALLTIMPHRAYPCAAVTAQARSIRLISCQANLLKHEHFVMPMLPDSCHHRCAQSQIECGKGKVLGQGRGERASILFGEVVWEGTGGLLISHNWEGEGEAAAASLLLRKKARLR